MSDAFGWGIVGPGEIARVFAAAVTESGVGRVVGVTGGRPGRAEELAAKYGAGTAASVAELTDLAGVEAIYVATPHTAHGECAFEALRRGVPVLCEKPITGSLLETSRLHNEWAMLDNPVELLEGWMYRAHPQIDRLLERIKRGDIGIVQRIESAFGFRAPFDPAHRLFNPDLGGGAILDVGGYPVSFALLASLIGLGMESQIDIVEGSVELAPTGVEQDARARFLVGDVVAELEVSMTRELGRVGRVIGDQGTLELEDPFLPEGRRRGRVGRLTHTDARGKRTEEVIASELDCFALEAQAFARLIRGETDGRPPPNMIPLELSLVISEQCECWKMDSTGWE